MRQKKKKRMLPVEIGDRGGGNEAKSTISGTKRLVKGGHEAHQYD